MNEWSVWSLDQHINDMGLPVDLELVESVILVDTEHKRRALGRLKEITGLTNPNSIQQLSKWLGTQGVTMKGLAKADVDKALNSDISDLAREALILRQQTAQTGVKKFQAYRDRTSDDGNVKGTLMFCGAGRTGRWAGRGVQIQNLPRGSIKDITTAIDAVNSRDYDWVASLYSDIPSMLGSLARAAICAPEGQLIIDADYSAIEARVLPWVAGDEKTLDVFRSGRDIYVDAASGIFNTPYNSVTKDQRFIGKISILACGYQGGKGAYRSMADAYGVDIEEEKAKSIVSAWREANPAITGLWAAVERAARLAIETESSCDVVTDDYQTPITFKYENPFLLCKLPSGRSLAYYRPRIEVVETSWGEEREQITFFGQNTYTRKWERVPTYGGKLVENIVQAISRDLLAHALLRVDKAGLNIVGHVHDEIICLGQGSDLDILITEMTTNPDWAKGLPLEADGWVGERFKK